MTRRSQQGRLIVFEGPDGVGKSTLSHALANKLKDMNIPCKHLAFPGNEAGTLGRLVYDLHHDTDVFGLHGITSTSLQALHIAAHLDAIEQRILPALRKGHWVVLDRFWWSTWVYGNVGGVDRDSLDAMIRVELLQWNDIKPEVVFVVERTRDSSRNQTHDCLRKGYRALIKKEQGQYPIRVIDNDALVDEALDQLLGNLRVLIPRLGYTRWDADPPNSPRQLHLVPPVKRQPPVFGSLAPTRPTVVYDTLWRFAVKRQEVFFRKLAGCPPPWTHDPIITRYKFTNAYRASDRVSQYLIRHVIYDGDQSLEEIFFRTILFKLFNKIETWELLKQELGTLNYGDYSFEHYDEVLSGAISSRIRIYSAAYIMPAGKSIFGHSRKHRNHLRLLELMMEDNVPHRVADTSSMKQAFEVLRSYPTIGDFLAYQYVTDLNYSEIMDFTETEFVVPGPGSIDGIHKCFDDMGGLNETDIIRIVTASQEKEFAKRGLQFRSLWGRPLQLIDCQNLFCEVSKYARLKHPEVKGFNERTRIKQIYRPSERPLAYWYPPKWGINHLIPESGSPE